MQELTQAEWVDLRAKVAQDAQKQPASAAKPSGKGKTPDWRSLDNRIAAWKNEDGSIWIKDKEEPKGVRLIPNS